MGVLTRFQQLIFKIMQVTMLRSSLGIILKIISIELGGSGGYGIFYIYSFRHNIPRLLFDFEKYNNSHTFKVNYEYLYKVSVGSPSLDLLFTLDISYKGYDYLSQLY